ncbi:hypothetical protein PCYB_053360 [Plasmodium cynomolgi strain B]|uniref:Uncharacterized protein n=1 Tax=Plasmodium cynomolgi (strain B) TaxID=1120755 RepID=K6UIT9_PLACD|nr:hypothetical protein PCYB_053360 [Plasmodium cynomolgi strain B]GAB65318.1 hypothetical protein PCYB_053360 [Plasmodium cynomolgi strain B]
MVDPMGEATCRSVERIFDGVSFNKSDRKKLQFEDKKLNRFFENGILNYSLVEVVGVPGTGKTQFALTLCAELLLKNMDEKKQAIVFYDFFQLIKKDIYYILKHHQISLLVVDSLNSLFNANDNLDSYRKCQLFTGISQTLKKLAYENNFFLLVLNSWQPRRDYINFSFNIFDYVINSSFSNTIIFFKKRKRKNEIYRRMTIKHSEFLRKYKSMRFEINDSGFRVS